jgi:hypothetical protein
MGEFTNKGITLSDGRFSNVRALGEPYGNLAAESLYEAYQRLRGSGADSAAKRLLMLDAAVPDLDLPSLPKLVSSDSALDEVLAKSQNRVHLLSTARSATALFSGIFTLLALAAAGIVYENLLATHRKHSGPRGWLTVLAGWRAGTG